MDNNTLIFLLLWALSFASGWMIGNAKGYKEGIEDGSKASQDAFDKAISEFQKAIENESERSKE